MVCTQQKAALELCGSDVPMRKDLLFSHKEHSEPPVAAPSKMPQLLSWGQLFPGSPQLMTKHSRELGQASSIQQGTSPSRHLCRSSPGTGWECPKSSLPTLASFPCLSDIPFLYSLFPACSSWVVRQDDANTSFFSSRFLLHDIVVTETDFDRTSLEGLQIFNPFVSLQSNQEPSGIFYGNQWKQTLVNLRKGTRMYQNALGYSENLTN